MWIVEGGRVLSRLAKARRTDDLVFVTLLLSMGVGTSGTDDGRSYNG